MRNAMGAIGLAAGAIVIALVAHFGYVTSAGPKDGVLAASLFAVVAAVALIGPALALRLFHSPRRLGKPAALVVAALAMAALAANLANSLGALDYHAERARAADARRADEAALAQLKAERADLHLTPTTDADVASARNALVEADSVWRAECNGGRGKRCEELIANLAAKRDAYAAKLKDRATTDRAEKLDREAAGIRARLDAPPAVPTAAPQPLRVPDFRSLPRERAATLAAIELLIALSLLAWEWVRLRPRTTDVAHEAIRKVPIGTAKREPADTRDLAIFVRDCMRRTGGETVELRTLYSRFLEWCDAQQLSPLPPRKFSEAFIARCAEADIDVRCEGPNVLLLDVSLAPADSWRH